MTISFEGTPTRATVTTGSLVIDKPTTGVTLANNDYLHVLIERDDNVSTVTLPTGWVLWSENLEGSGDDRSCVAARKLITNAAGEGTDYTFTWSADTGEPSIGTIWVVRGVDISNPEDATTIYSSQNSSAAPNCLPITTVTDGAVVMAFAGAVNNSGSTDPVVSGATFPTGYTPSGGSSNAGFDSAGSGAREPQWLACYKTVATAGIEDPGAFGNLANALNDFQCLTIAFRPATPPSNDFITSVGNFDIIFDNELRVFIEGSGFESVKGAATVHLNDTDELTGNEVLQTTRSWADRDIEFDVDKGGFAGLGDDLFLIVTTDGGVTLSLPVTVKDDTGNPSVRLNPAPQSFELGISFSLAANEYIWDSNTQEALIFTGSGLVPGLSVSGTFIQGTIDPDAGVDSPYTTTIRATDPDANYAESTFTHTVTVPTDTIEKKICKLESIPTSVTSG